MVSAERHECFAPFLRTIITHGILIGQVKLWSLIRGCVKGTPATIALQFPIHNGINFALERNRVFCADSELEVFLCCHALWWWVVEIDVWGCPLVYINRVLSFFVNQVGDNRFVQILVSSLDDWRNIFVFLSLKRVIRARCFSAWLSSKERFLKIKLSLVLLYINSPVLFPQFIVQMFLLFQEFFFVVSQFIT